MIGQRSTYALDFYRMPRLAEIVCGGEHDGDEIVVTLTLACTNYYPGCRADPWSDYPSPAEPEDAELNIVGIKARLWALNGQGSRVSLTELEVVEVRNLFDRAHADAVNRFLEDARDWRCAA